MSRRRAAAAGDKCNWRAACRAGKQSLEIARRRSTLSSVVHTDSRGRGEDGGKAASKPGRRAVSPATAGPANHSARRRTAARRRASRTLHPPAPSPPNASTADRPTPAPSQSLQLMRVADFRTPKPRLVHPPASPATHPSESAIRRCRPRHLWRSKPCHLLAFSAPHSARPVRLCCGLEPLTAASAHHGIPTASPAPYPANRRALRH